ncbi:uncharacterized protein LOC143446141 [Clavelina lepadiformis]|uniref:Uncharacterized protein n=1 Tax=Clavelina lepadiformis TaxID=159417 RepID=A0ABP0GSI7_CLALP
MFSGALASRNLSRKSKSLSADKVKSMKAEIPAVKKKNKKRKHSPNLINWNDTLKPKANCANLRPTYALHVKGNVRLQSPGVMLTVIGFCVLIISIIVTTLTVLMLYGSIGIGVGIYAMLIGITMVLENRETSSKLYHIQDIYMPHAVKSASRTEDRTFDNEVTKLRLKTQNKRKPGSRPLLIRQSGSKSQEFSPNEEKTERERSPLIFSCSEPRESPNLLRSEIRTPAQ